MLVRTPEGRLLEAEPVDSTQDLMDGMGQSDVQVQLPSIRAYSDANIPDSPLVCCGKILARVAALVQNIVNAVEIDEPFPENFDDPDATATWQSEIVEVLQEIANLMVQQGWTSDDLQRAYSVLEQNNLNAGLYASSPTSANNPMNPDNPPETHQG